MFNVAILESDTDLTTELIKSKLLGLEAHPPVTIIRGESLDYFTDYYDLLVVAPGEYDSSIEGPEIHCKIMLIPGNAPISAIARIRSRWAVSYGLSVRDSITVSSLERDSAVLALQRELVTLGGNIVEQQEIPIKFPVRSGRERIMAAFGCLLILDIPPKSLSDTTP